MNFSRLKSGIEYLGGVLIATFFVVLLSFIFSFLGTIFCAALAGMMLGALRKYKWHAVPLSLIFPSVIVGLMRVMKTELTSRQIAGLAVVCLCVFWVAYIAGMALFVLERPKAGQTQARTQNGLVSPATAAVVPGPAVNMGQIAETTTNVTVIDLQMLQGTWCPEVNGVGSVEKRRLSIENQVITLSVVDSHDHVKVLARGMVKVCTPG